MFFCLVFSVRFKGRLFRLFILFSFFINCKRGSIDLLISENNENSEIINDYK